MIDESSVRSIQNSKDALITSGEYFDCQVSVSSFMVIL